MSAVGEKMSKLLKAMYGFSSLPIRITVAFFTESKKKKKHSEVHMRS